MESQFDSVMDTSRRAEKKPGTGPGAEVDAVSTVIQLIPSQFGNAMETAGM